MRRSLADDVRFVVYALVALMACVGVFRVTHRCAASHVRHHAAQVLNRTEGRHWVAFERAAYDEAVCDRWEWK